MQFPFHYVSSITLLCNIISIISCYSNVILSIALQNIIMAFLLCYIITLFLLHYNVVSVMLHYIIISIMISAMLHPLQVKCPLCYNVISAKIYITPYITSVMIYIIIQFPVCNVIMLWSTFTLHFPYDFSCSE